MSNSLQPTDCSPPGSSVCGIFQARILEWVAISFSRGSFLFRDQILVSCLPGRFFITKPPGKPILLYICVYIHICVYMCVCTFIRCLENYNWFLRICKKTAIIFQEIPFIGQLLLQNCCMSINYKAAMIYKEHVFFILLRGSADPS